MILLLMNWKCALSATRNKVSEKVHSISMLIGSYTVQNKIIRAFVK